MEETKQLENKAIAPSPFSDLLDCAIPKRQRFTLHDVLRSLYPDGYSYNEKVSVSMALIKKSRRGQLRLVGRVKGGAANIYEAI